MRFGNACGIQLLSLMLVFGIGSVLLSSCQMKREFQNSSGSNVPNAIKIPSDISPDSAASVSPVVSAEIQSLNETLNSTPQYALSPSDVEELRSHELVSPEDEALLTSLISN